METKEPIKTLVPIKELEKPSRLSPNDEVMPPVYTRIIYYFKTDGSPNFMDSKSLQSSLQKTLELVPILGGSLVPLEDGGLKVEPKSSPTIPFIEATYNHTLESILSKPWSETPDEFVPCGPFPLPGDPLFLVKLTRLACSSVALCLAIHHSIADGHSTFNFFNSWGRIHRGLPVEPFDHDRNRLIVSKDEKPTFEHKEYKVVKRTPPSGAPASFTLPPLKAQNLKFSKQQLETLKQKCSESEEFSKEPKVDFISTNDAIVGYLWRAVTKARGIPADQLVAFGQALNARSRAKEGTWSIPDNYFGCANFYAYEQVKAGELTTKHIAYAAKISRLAVERTGKSNYIYSALCWIQQQHRSEIQAGFNSFLGSDLALTNWSKFPLYGLDFGHGKPVRVTIPAAKWDGLAIILPDHDEGVEIYLGLLADHFDKFENDPDTKI